MVNVPAGRSARVCPSLDGEERVGSPLHGRSLTPRFPRLRSEAPGSFDRPVQARPPGHGKQRTSIGRLTVMLPIPVPGQGPCDLGATLPVMSVSPRGGGQIQHGDDSGVAVPHPRSLRVVEMRLCLQGRDVLDRRPGPEPARADAPMTGISVSGRDERPLTRGGNALRLGPRLGGVERLIP